MSLPAQDHHHFLAAEGWLELGNIQECHNELEEISPMYKTHRRALELLQFPELITSEGSGLDKSL